MIISVPICPQYNSLQNLCHYALTHMIKNKDLLLTSTQVKKNQKIITFAWVQEPPDSHLL